MLPRLRLIKNPNYKLDAPNIIGKEPFNYKSLVKKSVSSKSDKTKRSFKKYSSDVYKADEIFDHLLEGKVLKFPDNVELPSKEDSKGKKNYKMPSGIY